MPGVSGNPRGRPKGLARRVRELVGDDGHAIADFIFTVMSDAAARTADGMEAAKWLADSGFGRAIQAVDVDLAQHSSIDVNRLSAGDLETLIAIVERYEREALRPDSAAL